MTATDTSRACASLRGTVGEIEFSKVFSNLHWIYPAGCGIVLCCDNDRRKRRHTMNILEELYLGNIDPQKRTREYEKEYNTLLGYADRHESVLRATLTEQQNETLQKLIDCYDEMCSIGEINAFINGFKLAVQIMIEITKKK